MNLENKEYILGHLANALAFTRTGVDHLEYKGGEDEYVIIHFDNGYAQQIDVTGDSGVAMMRDVLKAL